MSLPTVAFAVGSQLAFALTLPVLNTNETPVSLAADVTSPETSENTFTSKVRSVSMGLWESTWASTTGAEVAVEVAAFTPATAEPLPTFAFASALLRLSATILISPLSAMAESILFSVDFVEPSEVASERILPTAATKPKTKPSASVLESLKEFEVTSIPEPACRLAELSTTELRIGFELAIALVFCTPTPTATFADSAFESAP